MDTALPNGVAEKLGYYVYLYYDPRTNQPFYVGKGQGRRVLAHLDATGESRKAKVLEELRAFGLKPRIEVLAHGLRDEETALRIEAAVIDLLSLDNLTNSVRGWRSVQMGRMPLSELVTYYAPTPGKIVDPVLLIRINRLYRHGMSAEELYEATRGVWKVGPRRTRAQYALAVFEGVVREVYAITTWHKAGTTAYLTRDRESVTRDKRWEFDGQVASEEVRNRYFSSSVREYLPHGFRSSVVFVNC